MSKNKTIIVSLAVIAAIFILFWKSTFLVFSSEDASFLAIYVIILIWSLIIIYIKEFKNKVLTYILVGVLCLATFLTFWSYRAWNAEGYYIDVDDVENIEYMYYSEEDIGDNRTVIVSYTDKKEDIIANYNGAICVKDWNNLGESGTTDEYLYIYLKDGNQITINGEGDVYKVNKEKNVSERYRTEMKFKDFLP